MSAAVAEVTEVKLIDNPRDAMQSVFAIEIGDPVWITRECARDLAINGIKLYSRNFGLSAHEMVVIDCHGPHGWNIRRVYLTTPATR